MRYQQMQLMQMVIDGPEFARGNNQANGKVAVADLSRVADYLASNDGVLDCDLQGFRNKEDKGRNGHSELKLTITGELQLRCQRCLQAMAFPLRLEKYLRLIAPNAEWPEEDVEDEGFDVIEASKEMGVGMLIEDEVLLALPISPRHEICTPPVMKDSMQDASPFAVLRQLKID